METREPNYCPDCHRLELERIASKVVSIEKVKKEKKAREPAQKKKEKKERKSLRRPIEKPAEAVPILKEKPSEEEPVISREREEFWGDIEGSKGELRREPPVIPETRKRKTVPEDMREKAVLTAEGFPTRAPVEEARVVRGKHAPRRARKKIPGEGLVAFQVPEDYDGAVTPEPSYFLAILFGILAGVICAGAYAGIAWWRHREYGIIGWAMGIAVGVAVVLGSGRHFNWKLGILSAVLALAFISAGRLLMYMLTVWFPTIKIFSVPTMVNFKNALSTFADEFFKKDWLVFFSITGATSFLISFRPWPIRIEPQGQPVRAAKPRKA